MARPRGLGWLLLAHALGLLPGVALLVSVLAGPLGVDPIRSAVLWTGRLAILLLTLSLVPGAVRRLTGWGRLQAVRGTLGLYAFAYAAAHLALQVGVDYRLDLGVYADAVLRRRYGLAGLAAFLLLVPLAVTSTRGWMRRLGPWWRRLHYLVYPGAVAAVVHYLWTVKAERTAPYAFAAVVGVLLLMRAVGRREPPGGLSGRPLP